MTESTMGQALIDSSALVDKARRLKIEPATARAIVRWLAEMPEDRRVRLLDSVRRPGR
jgi:type II secretory pathway component PulM